MCVLGEGLIAFLFSSRRRHTRFDCDWSSDVCSSDLWRRGGQRRLQLAGRVAGAAVAGSVVVPVAAGAGHEAGPSPPGDRKRGVEGKSVDLGGRRIIKKKKEKHQRKRAPSGGCHSRGD